MAEALRLNKARAQCLARIVIGAAKSKSVLLSDLATRLPGNATATSKFRRPQDFFCGVLLDFNAVTTLIMGFVGKLTDQPLTLAMAWSYSCDTWSAEHVAPVKLKKHGRPEHSVFVRGLMPLGYLLHGVAKDLRRVSFVGILQAAGAVLEK